MKLLVLIFTLLFLYSCDSKTATDVAASDQATNKKDNSSDVKNAVNKGAPKWVIDYSGDMQGTIQGLILVPGGTQIGGGAMTKDMKNIAPEKFMLTILNMTTPPTVSMTLTLADGTGCQDAGNSTANIIDEERKTFRAEAAGELVCGDKHISYKAKMNKNP